MSDPATDELELPVTFGRYQLLAKIAAGGAATVYLARMVGKAGFRRTVAVKVLHRHLASDPEFVAMFLDEARLSARISHPNVVDVYDVDALSGRLLIVMEYVEGAALDWLVRQYRKQRSLVPLELTLRVVHDALLGLHAAHELHDDQGVPLALIHRDVSPQNILVGTDGLTRMTDFGIAKARGRMATTLGKDIVKGKLCYLAPEQITQGEVDRRVDVFAAGIVLWELLTGTTLFVRGTDQATIAATLNADVPPPSLTRRALPQAIDAVCLKALQRQPADRFDTAADMAAAIEEAAGTRMLPLRATGELVTEFACYRIEKVRKAMSLAADRSSINTPMVSSETDLPRQIAESLVDPSEMMGGLHDGADSARPVAGDTPMRHALRRRRTLVVAVGTIVLGAAVGWAVIASWVPAEQQAAGDEPSPEPAADTEPGADTSLPVATAAGSEVAPATTSGGVVGPADAGADATAKPEKSARPRRGGGKKNDGLYWPSRL